MGERGLGFVLFISLLQAVSLCCFSGVGLAFQQPGWCGPPGQRAGRGVQGRGLSAGRGLPAERGGQAHPRLAASSSAGRDGGGGRSRMLVSSVQLQACSSSEQRQLAPAGEGDPAALCARTLVSHPRGSSGES